MKFNTPFLAFGLLLELALAEQIPVVQDETSGTSSHAVVDTSVSGVTFDTSFNNGYYQNTVTLPSAEAITIVFDYTPEKSDPLDTYQCTFLVGCDGGVSWADNPLVPGTHSISTECPGNSDHPLLRWEINCYQDAAPDTIVVTHMYVQIPDPIVSSSSEDPVSSTSSTVPPESSSFSSDSSVVSTTTTMSSESVTTSSQSSTASATITSSSISSGSSSSSASTDSITVSSDSVSLFSSSTVSITTTVPLDSSTTSSQTLATITSLSIPSVSISSTIAISTDSESTGSVLTPSESVSITSEGSTNSGVVPTPTGSVTVSSSSLSVTLTGSSSGLSSGALSTSTGSASRVPSDTTTGTDKSVSTSTSTGSKNSTSSGIISSAVDPSTSLSSFSTPASTATSSATSSATGIPGLPQTVGDFVLAGCAGSVRNFPTFDMVSSDVSMDIETCTGLCSGNYSAGLYRDQCFCGPQTNDISIVDTGLCNIPCSRNPNEFCGGDMALTKRQAIPATALFSLYVNSNLIAPANVSALNVTTAASGISITVLTSITIAPVICISGSCSLAWTLVAYPGADCSGQTVYTAQSCGCNGGWAYQPIVCTGNTCVGKTVYKPAQCGVGDVVCNNGVQVFVSQPCSCPGGVMYMQAVITGSTNGGGTVALGGSSVSGSTSGGAAAGSVSSGGVVGSSSSSSNAGAGAGAGAGAVKSSSPAAATTTISTPAQFKGASSRMKAGSSIIVLVMSLLMAAF